MRAAVGIAVAFSIAASAGAYTYLEPKTASAKTAPVSSEGVVANPGVAGDEIRTAGQDKR